MADFYHTSIDYILNYEPSEYPRELAYVELKEACEKAGVDVNFELMMPPEKEK